MPHRFKLNYDEIKDELKELYYSDVSMEKIGEHFGVSGHQIGVLVKKFGWKDRYQIHVENERRRLIDQILNGKSMTELAREEGISPTTMSERLRRYGIKYQELARKITWRDVNVEKVVQMLTDGKVIPEIAKELGISENSIRNACKATGISIVSIQNEFKEKRSQEILSKLSKINTENYFVEQLVRELDMEVSRATLQFVIDEYDIPIKKTNSYNREELRKHLESGLTFAEISAKYYNNVHPDSIYRAARELGILEFYKNKGNSPSIGEINVKAFLDKYGIAYERNRRIDGIKGRNKDYVFLDFVVTYEGASYIIEYNGEQHYKFIPRFHINHDGFKKQVERDKSVDKWAKENGYNIIWIDYTYDTPKKVEDLLIEKLFNQNTSTTEE